MSAGPRLCRTTAGRAPRLAGPVAGVRLSWTDDVRGRRTQLDAAAPDLRHRELQVGAPAGGDLEAPVLDGVGSLQVVPVDGNDPVGRRRPRRHGPVVGVDDAKPDGVARARPTAWCTPARPLRVRFPL